jgi:SAM-dependent methyltransferase
MYLSDEPVDPTSTLSGLGTCPGSTDLSPALRGMLETFVAHGSRCLNMGQGNDAALGSWLLSHGCTQVDLAPSRATVLPHEDESFDAVLLIGVLNQLGEPNWAATELRRVLRPGGVLLVTAMNPAYWRQRLNRSGREDESSWTVRPSCLRSLLVENGFSLVGVEGQDGAFIRDLPLIGRLSKGRASGPYRVAERFFPALLGAQVGAFAIRV